MKHNKDYPDMPTAAESQPRVSLILPFELKMNQEKGLFDLLTLSSDKIEKELRLSYSEERTIPVIKKLREVAVNLKIIFLSFNLSGLYFTYLLKVRRFSTAAPTELLM